MTSIFVHARSASKVNIACNESFKNVVNEIAAENSIIVLGRTGELWVLTMAIALLKGQYAIRNVEIRIVGS